MSNDTLKALECANFIGQDWSGQEGRLQKKKGMFYTEGNGKYGIYADFEEKVNYLDKIPAKLELFMS